VIDLEEVCAQVIADGAPFRREVRDGDRWFLLRIAPYTRSDRRIGGTVLTLTNVTAFRASMEQAIYEREYTKAILNTVIGPLVVLDTDLRVQTANRAFYAMFQVSREETQGVPLYDLGNHDWNTPRLWTLLKETVSNNSEFQALEVEHDFPAIGRRTVLLDARRLSREGNPGHMILLAFQDITERKEAEAAKVTLAAIVESSDDAIISKDLNGIIASWNRGAEQLFGYRDSEIIGKPITLLIPPDRHDEEAVILARMRRGQRMEHYETIRRCKDGRLRDISLTVSPIKDAEGRIIGASKIARDITERKQAEEAMRRRTAQFETLLNEAPLGVYLVDGDFRIRQVNPTALPVFGNIPDLIGRDFDEVIHILWSKAYADEIVERFRQTLETGEPYIVPERIEKHRDRGVTEFYESQINRIPLPEGGYGVVCYFRDISAQVLARVAIAESEQRFRQLADTMPQIVWTAQPDGHLDYYNERWYEFTGFPRDEFGQSSWQRILHADDVQRCIDTYFGCIRAGKPFQIEYRFKDRVDGGYRWFMGRALPIRNEQNEIVKWFGTCTDIDDQKRTEEKLETTVAERTKDLQQANRALLLDMEERKKLEQQLWQAQKLESIGTLAGGVAHDFNNILNIIKGYTTHIREYPSIDENVAESLHIIEETVERGASGVRQLLTLARKTEARVTLINPNDLLSELSKLLKQTFPKTIDIVLGLDAKLPSISVDSNQINQALLNLCVNARDAMSGGGRLTLRSLVVEGGKIQDLAATAERYVCMEVKDTGAGMDASVRSRIFEPFFTTKSVGEGTGLGLAMVYGIVKAHNAFVDSESELGHGTTFRLYFPIAHFQDAPAAVDEMSRGPLAAPKSASGGTVLVVEDEEKMVYLLRKALLRNEYDVLVALDGAQAVDLYHRHKQKIRVVFLDVGLPKISGWELVLRMKEENPNVKVIVTSGYIEPDLKSKMQHAGVDGFVQKPYNPADVVKMLCDSVETH